MQANTVDQVARYEARLKIGDKIFTYIKGCGYVGYGQVLSEAVPMRDYFVESEGKHLQEMKLTAPEAKTRIDDDEKCDYVVGVQWLKVEPRENAVPYTGLQVWRGVVKRIGKGKTVDHLVKVFDALDRPNPLAP